MLCYSVDIPRSQVCPLLPYFPVFHSEVEVGVFSTDAKHVGYAHRVSSRAVQEEPGSYGLAASCRANLEKIPSRVDRFDLETKNEPNAFTLCVSPQRSSE